MMDIVGRYLTGKKERKVEPARVSTARRIRDSECKCGFCSEPSPILDFYRLREKEQTQLPGCRQSPSLQIG